MALNDFLNNGQVPDGSAFKSSTTSTALPDWYTNYAMQVLSNQNAQAATPFPLFQGPRVAEFSPQQQQGFGMTNAAAGAFQPGLNSAIGTTNAAAAAPGALSVAQPFLNQAGQNATDVSAYMNPYTNQVVNRIGELGNRNLTENILPAVEGRYIGAGQLGFGGRGPGQGTPSGMMTDTARAVRDTSADILAQQTAALNAQYGQAQGIMQTDLSRQGQLANVAGNLATAQNNQQLAAGQQQGALGALAQRLGLLGANAVTGVGTMQQGQAQQNVDVAYADFLRQQGYPQEQINAAVRTLGAVGQSGAVPKAVTEQGIIPTGVFNPSTGETIGGALTGLAGILGSAKAGTALGNLFGVGG